MDILSIVYIIINKDGIYIILNKLRAFLYEVYVK